MKAPKPIRRSDGKVLKFAGYNIPDAFAKSDAQDIAETFERIVTEGFGVGTFCDDHYYYPYDDDDSCIEMN